MKKNMISSHWKRERKARKQLIDRIGWGYIINGMFIDKGHAAGREWHALTDNGIIKIYNAETMVFCTALVARPAQIKRFFTDEPAPQWLIETAKYHVSQGYNRV